MNRPTGEGSIVSLKLKAEEGDAKAQYQLGTAYATGGKGVRKDYKTAIAWLEKAAQKNHVGAQLELGNLYESAGYALRDYEKSYHWVEKAAVIGNLPEAYYALAFKYSIGQGVRQDMSKAIEFYERKGAETGESSHLQYLTALGYKEGLAGRASPEKFHMGPEIFIKAFMGGSFSLTVFGWTPTLYPQRIFRKAGCATTLSRIRPAFIK